MSGEASQPNAAGGYVRLWRALQDNPVWTQLSPAVLKVMIGFLLKANWKPANWYDGSAEIEVPRGSFVTSYPKMARFCNLTVKQTRLAFDHLQRVRFAAYQRAPKWTMVTVLNYRTYQDSVPDEGTLTGSLRARSGHDEGTMRAPIEEGNKGRSQICASPDGNAPPDFLTCPDPTPARPRDIRDLTPQQEKWFSAWWSAYWRRRAKKAAREAFRRHVTTEKRFEQIMAATRDQSPEMLARSEDKRPHGATWLNGERWEDEPASPHGHTSTGGSVYSKWEPPVEEV